MHGNSRDDSHFVSKFIYFHIPIMMVIHHHDVMNLNAGKYIASLC